MDRIYWVHQKYVLWAVQELPADDVNELQRSGSKEFFLDAVLPEEFLASTTDKGLVMKNWAAHPAIHNHDSVRGWTLAAVVDAMDFLTPNLLKKISLEACNSGIRCVLFNDGKTACFQNMDK